MTFPGPGAVIIRNEAGEPLGWDYPSDDALYHDDDYNDAIDPRCQECGGAFDHNGDCDCAVDDE